MATDSTKRKRLQWSRLEEELRKMLGAYGPDDGGLSAKATITNIDTLLGDFTGKPFELEVEDRSRPMTPFYKPPKRAFVQIPDSDEEGK